MRAARGTIGGGYASLQLQVQSGSFRSRAIGGLSRVKLSRLRAEGLQLPAFEPGQRPMYPAPFNPAVFVPQVVDDPRRYSGDWHEAIEAEQRAQRERQEREEQEALAERRESWPGPMWEKGERA